MQKLFFLILICAVVILVGCRKGDQSHQADAIRAPVISDPSCILVYEGIDRKDIKLRPSGLSYPAHNSGKAISVAEWFALLCGREYESLLRDKFPNDASHQAEHLFITLRAYILLVKSEEDNDYHLQVADRPEWSLDNPQVIVEIPPGVNYCTARKNFEDILEASGGRVSNQETGSRATQISKRYYFKNPPLVEISGYLFLDAHHRRKDSVDLCRADGGRGVRGSKREVGQTFTESPVQGLWEIHPVLSIKRVR